MLFDRYGEVMVRLEELGARVGNLNNRDRQVMQNLLEEQEWLNATLVKRAKYLLEEIDRSFEKLFDWMISFSDLIDRASGHGGIPADVLRMERMMQDADDLRERLNRMVPAREQAEDVPFIITAGSGEKGPGLKPEKGQQKVPVGHLSSARREAAPANMQAEILADTNPPFLLPDTPRTNTTTPPLPSIKTRQPVEVVKKLKKKDRKKNKTNHVRQKYLPPQELLSALEQKMAAACDVPKIRTNTEKGSRRSGQH